MTSILCIYHSPCNDGSASAAALQYRLLGADYMSGNFEIRFCPLTYTNNWEDPLPTTFLENEVQPKFPVSEIYLVDISMSAVKYNQIVEYLRSEEQLASAKPRTICIDHHQTALDKIDELRAFCDETYIKIGPGLSGATLVWNYFNERFGETIEAPLLLRYVADQDIWEWKLESSREVNAALNVLNGTVEEMERELGESLRSSDEWFSRRTTEGRAINAMVDSQVHRSARQVADVPLGEKGRMLLVNATSFSSELGNYLCERHERTPDVVAVIYSLQDNWNVRCSIRSVPGGTVNARGIAERFGGGGHEHAAGCRFDVYAAFRAAMEEVSSKG
jgi:oligoribonuclease NrnB/cAMP/cGMP phosphodiesterase (DHH superfamily)